MDPGELFGAIVMLAVGAIILLTLDGGDPSFLINILPEIVVASFFFAMVLAFAQSI